MLVRNGLRMCTRIATGPITRSHIEVILVHLGPDAEYTGFRQKGTFGVNIIS